VTPIRANRNDHAVPDVVQLQVSIYSKKDSPLQADPWLYGDKLRLQGEQ